MQKKKKSQLALALRDKLLVRFASALERGTVNGYVLDIGSQFFLIALVLFFINTITYYLRFLSPPCYARFGRALICHEKARTRSSLPNKSERSWNDEPINIRYHILLWRGPR